MSVVHDVADGGAVFRGEWDRVVSDWSVNCAGLRELLPDAGECSGVAREPRITSEVVNVLAQFISREELPPLVARLKQSAPQENPAESKVPPDAEVRWQQLLSPQGASTHIHLPGTGEPVFGVFLVRSFGSEWTLLFRSCLRDGRLTSRMVSIEQCGPGNRQDAFSRKTKTDPGGGGGGHPPVSLPDQRYM